MSKKTDEAFRASRLNAMLEGYGVNEERPVFEVHERDGKTYRIWANGWTEGFAEGAVIVNGVWPLLHMLRALKSQEKAKSSIAGRQEEGPSAPAVGARTERRPEWFWRMMRRLARNKA